MRRTRFLLFALFPSLCFANEVALDNDYVRVTRGIASCTSAAAPGCGERVIVAIGDIELQSGDSPLKMTRGDIAVFQSGESFQQPIGEGFFEVVIKPHRPGVLSPAEVIPPEKNTMRYDGTCFFIFEEKLEPGDTRARHSHSQRVVIQLNRTRLQQWPDGAPAFFVDVVPEKPLFNPPVIHEVKNVGDTPLRGIIIEFKPEGQALCERTP